MVTGIKQNVTAANRGIAMFDWPLKKFARFLFHFFFSAEQLCQTWRLCLDSVYYMTLTDTFYCHEIVMQCFGHHVSAYCDNA